MMKPSERRPTTGGEQRRTPPAKTALMPRALLRRLLRTDRGSVSVELALITPLIMLIMLGFSEMYLYMRAVSSVEHTAFTLADSIGQMSEVINDQTTTSPNNLGAIWSAAALIAAPSKLQSSGGVVVTSICDATTVPCGTAAAQSTSLTALGTPQIYWQAQAPWNAKGAGTKETTLSLLPTSWPFRSGDSAIVVEVFYVFDPFSLTRGLWTAAPGTQTIYRRVYVRQRSGGTLALVAS
ncbi:MAG: TadE/TadG family type IV pilus assembly protein [Janthinobacterium lividum]